MKAVFDTNVIISGIFWRGSSYEVLDAWRNNKITSITSVEILDEVARTLKDFKIRLSEDAREDVIDLIARNSIIVLPREKITAVKDDPDDDKFIEAAVEGEAQYIITQDNHLLKMREYRDVRIITPVDCLKML